VGGFNPGAPPRVLAVASPLSRFGLNPISRQEPGRRRRKNPSREGCPVNRGGEHAWGPGEPRPLRKRGCFGLRKRGFGLYPESFAAEKSGEFIS